MKIVFVNLERLQNRTYPYLVDRIDIHLRKVSP